MTKVTAVAIVAVYAAFMTAWIYLEDDFPLRIPLGILAHFSLGLVTGRPWVIAAPALVPLLAIPTETEDAGAGWAFALVIVAIPGAILVALGVALRRWLGATPRK